MVEYHLFSSPILTTFLSCGCCKSTNKSASCICPLPSCYDWMSNYTWTCLHQHLVQGCSVISSFICKGNTRVPRLLCAGSGGQQREGEERDLPKDTVFPEDALRCSSTLQCSHHSPCQQLNQKKPPRCWLPCCPCTRRPDHTTCTCWD